MPQKNKKNVPSAAIRISTLEVSDFKALDHLKLTLPSPKMASDPDVFVLGSRNGLGKTSVLEACALLLTAARMEASMRKELLRMTRRSDPRYDRSAVDLADLFVRSGCEKSTISADIEAGKAKIHIQVTVSRDGWIHMEPEKPLSQVLPREKESYPPWVMEQTTDALASFSPEPLAASPLLYFHSNRRVSEGAPEFGAWVERGSGAHPARWRRPSERATSAFKMELLGLLMRKADLFESRENGKEESAKALDQLNEFIERYAGGRIDKLLPAPDNTVDFRIAPKGGGRSFSFDGLSSGQKEVISTLYLTWRHSREAPMILLIDEPELHLNPEWQRDFVQQIYRITPSSQLIIATHSEHIFESVSEDRRILLGD